MNIYKQRRKKKNTQFFNPHEISQAYFRVS